MQEVIKSLNPIYFFIDSRIENIAYTGIVTYEFTTRALSFLTIVICKSTILSGRPVLVYL